MDVIHLLNMYYAKSDWHLNGCNMCFLIGFSNSNWFSNSILNSKSNMLFFNCENLNRRGFASVNASINRDVLSEAVGLPASEKPFCPPRKKEFCSSAVHRFVCVDAH